jgi:hypothetical protein
MHFDVLYWSCQPRLRSVVNNVQKTLPLLPGDND